jgi:5-methylcytosine-specific restriction protein A
MAHPVHRTPEWRRLRLAKLQEQPLCEVCLMRGRVTPANTVDHIVSINAGGDAFPTLDGLMSMCVACHNSKTRRTDQPYAKGDGIAYKGADASGMPIDPNHPFFGGARGITPRKDGQAKHYDRARTRKITKLKKGGH